MKGIILCAGQGTRLRPYTYSLPKTLIPVLNKPILMQCIEALLTSGITEIGVVIRPDQTAIVDYLKSISSIANLTVLYQLQSLGIANALLSAEPFLNRDSFILLLGDNLFTKPIKALQEAFRDQEGAVLLSPVSHPSDFGVAELEGDQIVRLEEKPPFPRSNLAVVGMYAFSSKVFDAIRCISPSPRGEYEITDAIQQMIGMGLSIGSCITREAFFDIGTPERWLEANAKLLSMRADQMGVGIVLENCTINGPVLIGDRCALKNVTIGPYVTLGNDCTVSDGKLSNSICLDHAALSLSGLEVDHSIFGSHSRFSVAPSNQVRILLGNESAVQYHPPAERG